MASSYINKYTRIKNKNLFSIFVLIHGSFLCFVNFKYIYSNFIEKLFQLLLHLDDIPKILASLVSRTYFGQKVLNNICLHYCLFIRYLNHIIIELQNPFQPQLPYYSIHLCFCFSFLLLFLLIPNIIDFLNI